MLINKVGILLKNGKGGKNEKCQINKSHTEWADITIQQGTFKSNLYNTYHD
jgi:hypothetical protein